MRSVIVVTDSSANLPAEQVRQLDIRVVPVVVTVNGRTYRDGVDITAEDVYRLQRTGKVLPTTSAPSVGDFLRVYAAAAEEASAIVSIHVSPRLSATHQVAATAAQLIDGATIRVLGCPTVAGGQGLVVLEAARTAAAGGDVDAVVARFEELAPKVTVLANLATLEYLHRGGRIGGAAAAFGAMLQIKPVVSVADGRVELFAKPRTRSRAIQIMLRQVADQTDGHLLHAAILHADAPDEAEALRQLVLARHRCAELFVTEFTPVMGAHAGPGVLGVAFYAESPSVMNLAEGANGREG